MSPVNEPDYGKPAQVDLVAALRASVEAARDRRIAREREATRPDCTLCDDRGSTDCSDCQGVGGVYGAWVCPTCGGRGYFECGCGGRR